MLSRDWNELKDSYDFVIIGSGYGGAITAARIANSTLNPKPSVCILERGKEWKVGEFPDEFDKYVSEVRSDANPLGLYEVLNYPDISVLKGSGLGGTSLVNANVAIIPDEDVFKIDGWPKQVTRSTLMPYYDKAVKTLAALPHPRAGQLPKVQALQRRAAQAGLEAKPLNIAVNFDIDGKNAHGVDQKPCIDCGDCVTGCNVGAKNTLYMNYLPMAAKGGAEIYTQTKVEYIKKLDGGGWQIHGRHYKTKKSSKRFQLNARNVILAAGSINSTEILLRSSQLHGLSVSAAIGTRFGGNGDFFGLAYNGDNRTQVLGFGNHPNSPGAKMPPGPTIVAAIRYNQDGPAGKRFTIEDLTFAKAYVRGAQVAFASLRGEDTDAGDEAAEAERVARDFFGKEPYHADGALNHTMLYLCMGIDDVKGYFRWERPITERDGRVTISWPGAGKQKIFSLINEELRRHARREGASFLPNPLWSFLNLGHLVTAHPLGGCPMGEDYVSGVVDQFGRVFAADGSVHKGLFVADGAILPSALAVNPFLTISAVAERIAERVIKAEGGDAYPAPPVSVGFAGLKPVEVISLSEVELERIFERAPCEPIEVMENKGGRNIDIAAERIENDEYWKGFFPKGNVLNEMSAMLYTGFKKKFTAKGKKFVGLTSDTDGRINARNSLEKITIKQQTGDLPPGDYVLLRYLDPPWQGFYDVFKVVSKDLLIGRVYLGEYPNGLRMFTFPMTRAYDFSQMTAEDHRQLYEKAAVPTAQELQGAWRMEVISNANQAGGMAYLSFDNKPDGRLESRYQLMGVLEGLIAPTFTAEHFQLNDFTQFRDEIRILNKDLMIGRWITDLPVEPTAQSLGIFHVESKPGRFGFYYLLRKAEAGKLPTNTLLSPLLDTRLPAGVGLTFDEQMVGQRTTFSVRMIIKDINEFIEGSEHEARMQGAIRLTNFQGQADVTFPIDEHRSYFNYLRINPETGEAEIRYYLEFTGLGGKLYSLEGRKLMQRDRSSDELLEDYTTLFSSVYEHTPAGKQELYQDTLKFHTFEDLAAVGNLAGFLRSFRGTGTDDVRIQLMAQLRFHAFTGQFVQREYDPLAPPLAAGGTV
ncbi:MAG: GMC family oxidoreductase [Acidimicrobiia bacterium]|nr:GMC family oxidoreductase [Acidimicrobiia bacterium]